MARGQITIEFILLLVLVLTIISTISIPIINRTTDSMKDTGGAVILSQGVSRIVKNSIDISLSGCGSRKMVVIDKKQISNSLPFGIGGIYIKNNQVRANFTASNGVVVNLTNYTLPNYIAIKCEDKGDYVVMNISKDCTSMSPSNDCDIKL